MDESPKESKAMRSIAEKMASEVAFGEMETTTVEVSQEPPDITSSPTAASTEERTEPNATGEGAKREEHVSDSASRQSHFGKNSDASEVDEGPDRSKIRRVDQNSLQARWKFEKWPVIRELWRAHLQMVTFYTEPRGGNHSLEDAIKMASVELGEGVMLEEEMERIVGWNIDSISWYTLDKLFRTNASSAQDLWEEIKEQALNDFKTGHFAAQMFERTDWQRDVWKRAHFVVVYEEMMEAYKPSDAIEHSMVEMVAVNFFLWRHWVMEHLQRATTEPRRESYDYQEWAKRNSQASSYFAGQKHNRARESHWTDGYWDIPYQHEAEAIQQALEMADRCRRAFHASVRSLRDWRRYNVPVIVQNAEQVNIAGEGAKQTNVQKKAKRVRKPKKPELAARPAIRLASGE